MLILFLRFPLNSSAAVQEKVLTLIKVWAETFANQPDLKGVVEVYQELRNKGIEFPAIDGDNLVPIITPQKVSEEHEQRFCKFRR